MIFAESSILLREIVEKEEATVHVCLLVLGSATMQENDDFPKIKVGDYIVLQRQKYMKLHKFGSLESSCAMGKDQLELRNIEGHPYFSTFKMVQKEAKGRKRLTGLEICSEKDMKDIKDLLNNVESGADNRNILDDGESQKLASEEILKLRAEVGDSTKIIGTLVENSTSFNSKTPYSQEKVSVFRS